MKLTVYPKVVAGTDRGGEDLYLVFHAQATGPLNPEYLEVTDLEIDGGRHGGVGVEVLEFDEASHRIMKVRWWSSYEFEWVGTPEDLKLLVGKYLKEETLWSRPGLRGNLCVFRYEHFVDGNAQ